MVASVMGFSLFLFVELVCFHGTILFPGLFGISQELSIALMTVSLLSKALGYFGASFISAFQRIPSVLLGKVGAVLFIGGILALPAITDARGLDGIEFAMLLMVIVSGAAIGVGDACINVLWGQQCASYQQRKAYLYVLGCQVGAALLYLMTFFISAAMQVVVVLMSLLIVLMLLFKIKPLDEPTFRVEGLRSTIGELWRPIFGTSVFCFLTGLMPWISGQYEGSVDAMRSASIVSTYLMLAILSVPALLVKRVIHLENIYKFLLPVVATGFLLLPFVWNGFGGVVNAFAGAGTYAAGIVLWCLAANSAQRHSLSAATVFGLSLGATTGASALGRVFGYFGGRSLTEGDVAITAISLVSLYLLSMIALVIFKQKPRDDESLDTAIVEPECTPKSSPKTNEPLGVAMTEAKHTPASSLKTDEPFGVAMTEPERTPASSLKAGSLLRARNSAFSPETTLPPKEGSLLSDRTLACADIAKEYQLSPRESEVLVYLAQGHSMVDIARELSVSENTARTHIKRIYRKLDVHSKQDIIDLCLKRG